MSEPTDAAEPEPSPGPVTPPEPGAGPAPGRTGGEPVDSAATAEPQSGGAAVFLTAALEEEIRGALFLLRFVVETGFHTPEGATPPRAVVTGIKYVAARFGIVDGGQDTALIGEPRWVSAEEWIEFEISYHALGTLTAPITAQTLRDTEDVGHGSLLFSKSPAQRFSRTLWGWTLFFVASVVFTQWWAFRYGLALEGEVNWQNTVLQGVDILLPSLYGGLGACAHLLRQAHTFIYQRCFDVRRKPEYFNRILLGTISGGAILLFVDHITDDTGEVVRLSSAALGFLAGYSTDFLFNTIERVIAAILPKVGIGSVQKAGLAPKTALEVAAGGTTLTDLMDRFDKAQGADKDMYRSLIEKLRDRL